MLAIGGIGTSTVMPRAARTSVSPCEPDTPTTGSRALIPVAAPTQGERLPNASRRPLAHFLAHLIATQIQAPQTRARRRAEPGDVIGIYAAAIRPRSVSRARFDGQA